MTILCAEIHVANALGLSDQGPPKCIILTDGVPRTVSLGKRALIVRRIAPRIPFFRLARSHGAEEAASIRRGLNEGWQLERNPIHGRGRLHRDSPRRRHRTMGRPPRVPAEGGRLPPT